MFSVPANNRAADYDPRARGWYKAANSAQQTIVTEPYIAASSGKRVITVSTPVQHQGQEGDLTKRPVTHGNDGFGAEHLVQPLLRAYSHLDP